jgi:hypothetical protein
MATATCHTTRTNDTHQRLILGCVSQADALFDEMVQADMQIDAFSFFNLIQVRRAPDPGHHLPHTRNPALASSIAPPPQS